MHGLLNSTEIRYVNAPVAAGLSIDDNSTIIDMADYESALFLVSITDSVATGVATLKVEQSDANSDDAMAAVSGAASTVTCAVNDDVNGTVLAVEVFHPQKRYIQAVITSSVANIAYGDTIVLLRPRRLPAVQGATVSDTAIVAN